MVGNFNSTMKGFSKTYFTIGLPYRLENSGHVRNLGLNFASGRNFKKCSNVRNFMMGVLGELELRE